MKHSDKSILERIKANYELAYELDGEIATQLMRERDEARRLAEHYRDDCAAEQKPSFAAKKVYPLPWEA